MNLIEKVKEVEAKYQQGNNIFRRVSVGLLLERISQLEQAAQQSVYSDVCHKSPSKKHSWYGSSQGYVCEHCDKRR